MKPDSVISHFHIGIWITFSIQHTDIIIDCLFIHFRQEFSFLRLPAPECYRSSLLWHRFWILFQYPGIIRVKISPEARRSISSAVPSSSSSSFPYISPVSSPASTRMADSFVRVYPRTIRFCKGLPSSKGQVRHMKYHACIRAIH